MLIRWSCQPTKRHHLGFRIQANSQASTSTSQSLPNLR